MNDVSMMFYDELKKHFCGLPGFCRLVMFELLTYCDFQTGFIHLPNLNEIAKNDFCVTPLPGRKKEVISADTIRNAFRTIKRAKPTQFIFSVINQRVVIEIPFIRELYQSTYGQSFEVSPVLAADIETTETHAQHSDSLCFDSLFVEDIVGDLAAATSQKERVKSNNLLNKNKTNNKQTDCVVESFTERRQPIEQDFYPTEETIDLALSKGLEKVTDKNEIRKFIHYNQANATRWVDYNPVFLNWLEREKSQSLQRTIQTNQQCNLRKNSNERPTYQVHTDRSQRNPTVAEAIRRNKEIIRQGARRPAYDFIDPEYSEFMGVTYEHLQQSLDQQVWC